LRAILQRVTQSSVVINDQNVGEIGTGIMALIGFGAGDSVDKLDSLIDKIIFMRIFPNQEGRFDKSLEDISGGLLLIPQFTLFADTSKGRRPEFFSALAPAQSAPLFLELVSRAKVRLGDRVASGIFGADMKVMLINDGPVTISIEI
jgi:D-tyrosyl-tRNA(Tyr) deacylase